jgi:2,3-bisphosphoglycerate-independent phosphoglycerate mutase
LKFGCFVQMPVERGIALLTGMQIIDVPSSTGHLDVDYAVWAKIALDAVKDFDGIYIHIKGPDEPAHDGDFKKKKEIIEYIDKHFFANLISGVDLKDVIICVTADHSSVCKIKAHSADPAPLLVCGGVIKPDKTKVFTEKSSKSGSLGELNGSKLLSTLVDFAKQ